METASRKIQLVPSKRIRRYLSEGENKVGIVFLGPPKIGGREKMNSVLVQGGAEIQQQSDSIAHDFRRVESFVTPGKSVYLRASQFEPRKTIAAHGQSEKRRSAV